MSNRYVPGYGNGAAKLVVCGEAPGQAEDEEGRPFVGPTGQETRAMLRSAGIAPESCFFMNILPYRPPNNDLKRYHETGHTIEEAIPEVWSTLEALTDANCVLALGNLALRILTGETGIKHWRGSILRSIGSRQIKVVPSYHPANLFERRGQIGLIPYQAKIYMQLDFNRAVEESLTKELELPKPNLNFTTRYIDLENYVERQLKQGRRIATFDIESTRCIPFCIGLAFSRHEGLSTPIMDLSHFGKEYYVSREDLVQRMRLFDRLFRDPTLHWIAQNGKYDIGKLECPVGFRMPELYADTALLAKLINPEFPAALEFTTSIYTRHPYYKDEWRNFDPKKDRPDKVLIYNARDCTTTFEVYEEMIKEAQELGLSDLFFNFLMPLNHIYYEMESVGFKVDFEVRTELYRKYLKMRAAAEDEMWKLTGYPVNCNSQPQVKLLLFSNLKIPKRASVDEDTLVSLINNTVKDERKRKILNYIIDIRRHTNALSKIASRPDYDQRMRTSFRLGGTEAGRTSTAVLKAPVRPNQVGMSFHSMTKHGELGGDLRKMYVPSSKDMVFINVDLSQAEARVVAVLSDDKELQQWFADGVDVHARTAGFIFGGDETRYYKSPSGEPPERAVGKIGRHSYGYGASEKRLAAEVNTQARRFHIDIQISIYRARKIIETLTEKCPAISENYWPTIRQIAHSTRTLRSAHGRVRFFGGRLNEDLYREMYSWIPQADVSDKLKFALIPLKKRFGHHLRLIVEAHDAYLAEIPRSAVADVAGYSREILETPIDYEGCTLSRGKLVIPCDVEIGENYKDLKKFKF